MVFRGIESGQRIPNYREFCKLMGEENKGGDSKKAQLKRWEYYFRWEKEGNAFLIREVYDAPKPSSDGRQKYLDDMKTLLMNYLHDQRYSKEQSVVSWLESLGVISMHTVAIYRGNENIPDDTIKKILAWRIAAENITAVARNIFENTLVSCDRDGIIQWAVRTYVHNEDGEHIATPEEKLVLDDCRERALELAGAANLYAVKMNPTKMKKFKEHQKQLLLEHGITDSYTLMSVTGSDRELIDYIARRDVQASRQNIKREIAKVVKGRIERSRDKSTEESLLAFEDETLLGKFDMDPFLACDICRAVEFLC